MNYFGIYCVFLVYDSYAAFLEEIEKYAPKTREENPSGEYTFESGRKVPHCILTEDEIKDGPKPGWQSMVLKGKREFF